MEVLEEYVIGKDAIRDSVRNNVYMYIGLFRREHGRAFSR